MLGFCSTTSWQHCDGGSVIPCFESFQFSEDCDHNVDKLGVALQFDVLSFLGKTLFHYLQIVVVKISLQFHWYMNLFRKSNEP
jgi:hypothetical protein